jgi:hypothetical protein
VSAEARQSPVATRRRSCFMDDLQRGQIRADVRSVIRGRTVCSNGDGGPVRRPRAGALGSKILLRVKSGRRDGVAPAFQ